jgi:hypothetical protein
MQISPGSYYFLPLRPIYCPQHLAYVTDINKFNSFFLRGLSLFLYLVREGICNWLCATVPNTGHCNYWQHNKNKHMVQPLLWLPPGTVGGKKDVH